MNEFIISDEIFKLGWMEKVPSPQEGECFLLYQTGAGMQNSFLVNYGVKYSSAEIRHGHYNQKAVFSLKQKDFDQSYCVVMKGGDFYFDVIIKMSYGLQDVKAYFFEGKIEEEDIQKIIRKAVRDQDGKYDIQEDIKLQNSLENEIEDKLEKWKGVRFRRLEVIVTPENSAMEMRNSKKKKIVGIHVSQNETDEQIARNAQAERIAESEYKLKEKKIDNMALMWKNFGNLGPIVEEYLDAKISGKELFDYIQKSRAGKMSMLQTAVSANMMTEKEIVERLNEILENNEFIHTAEYQQLPGKDKESLEEVNAQGADVEERSGEEEPVERKEEGSVVDGDYI